MTDWVKLINRLLDLLDEALAEHRRRQHRKAVDEIKRDPGGAWDDRFGVRDDADPERSGDH